MAGRDPQTFWEHVKDLRINDVVGFAKLGAAFVPSLIWRRRHPDTWVVSELPYNARDNGYWFFRYLRTQHPKLDAYYPIHRDSSDYDKVAPLGNVIEFGSMKHFILFLAANRYMTTTKQHGFPHERLGILWVLHNLARFRYVFLNHGVARGVSSIVDGRVTNYDMVVAISEAEKQVMVELNHQPAEIVQPIGFCRHDSLDNSMLERDLILFMPTWRMWLDYRHETEPQTIERIKRDYQTSPYRVRIQEMLQSPRLAQFLEKRNLHMLVYLHGYAQVYSDDFVPTSPRIAIEKKETAFIQDLLKRASYLITDYSSVIWDFAYMKKPCCYYQFDAEEFSQKQYAESEFFTYERDGFGPVFTELDEVIDDLERSCDTGFTMPEMYRQRVEAYFPSFGTDHCQQTYELVRALPDK